MARETYIATVQIVLTPAAQGVDSEAAACDWFSAFLDNPEVLDWSYLQVGGQYLSPMATVVSDVYNEGDAFK